MRNWMARHPVKRNTLLIAVLMSISLMVTPTGAVVIPGFWYDIRAIIVQGTSVTAGILLGYTLYNLVKEYRTKPQRDRLPK